jgi:hypothetical protein
MIIDQTTYKASIRSLVRIVESGSAVEKRLCEQVAAVCAIALANGAAVAKTARMIPIIVRGPVLRL